MLLLMQGARLLWFRPESGPTVCHSPAPFLSTRQISGPLRMPPTFLGRNFLVLLPATLSISFFLAPCAFIGAADCTYNVLLGCCYGFDGVAGPWLTHFFFSIAAVLGSSHCCNPQHVMAAWIKIAILDALVNDAFCVAVNLPRFVLRLAIRIFYYSVRWGVGLAQQGWCQVYHALHSFLQGGVALAQLCLRPVAINILSQVLIAYSYRHLGAALPWLSLLIFSRRGCLVSFNYSHSSWCLFALMLLLLPFLGMSMNAAGPAASVPQYSSGVTAATAMALDIGARAVGHRGGWRAFRRGGRRHGHMGT